MAEAAAPEYLTVRELADLLRIKERKVYDLASSGQVPCSRATGKLLFPAQDIRTWIEGRSSGGRSSAARPNVFLGSHDPLLSWALGQSRCGIATFFDGSLDGLDRFCRGEGIAAGVHIHDRASGDWNIGSVGQEAADQDAVLVSFARRRRGLVVKQDDAAAVSDIRDLPGRRVAGRQPESGTDVLFGHLLRAAGVPRGAIAFSPASRNEADAVLAVARGEADAAFGLESMSRQFGLGFVPVIEEAFDLLIDRRAWFEPPLQTFLAFCRGETFAMQAEALGGYDISGFGAVRWNAGR